MTNYTDTLKKTALFRGIELENLDSLLSCLGGKFNAYEKNETLFLAGQPVEYFGIVLEGQVQVLQEDYYGKRHILSGVGPQGLFGESFACGNIKNYPVTVIASLKSQVLLVDSQRIFSPCCDACHFHNQIINNLVEIIAQKNMALTQKINLLTRQTTRDKLLAFLSEQAISAGSHQFTIDFNRQELADYLSVERSAMSTELSKLKKSGVLDYHKNSFELLVSPKEQI